MEIRKKKISFISLWYRIDVILKKEVIFNFLLHFPKAGEIVLRQIADEKKYATIAKGAVTAYHKKEEFSHNRKGQSIHQKKNAEKWNNNLLIQKRWNEIENLEGH